VFRAFAIVVRVSYLLMMLICLALMLPLVAQVVALSPSGPWHWREVVFGTLLVITYLALPLRAAGRLLWRRELVPEAHVRERPVVATVVLLASALGFGLSTLIAWALLTRRPGEDVDIGGATYLTMALFAIAVLVGEIVLIGRQPPASSGSIS
jgi:hypothetical protein